MCKKFSHYFSTFTIIIWISLTAWPIRTGKQGGDSFVLKARAFCHRGLTLASSTTQEKCTRKLWNGVDSNPSFQFLDWLRKEKFQNDVTLFAMVFNKAAMVTKLSSGGVYQTRMELWRWPTTYGCLGFQWKCHKLKCNGHGVCLGPEGISFFGFERRRALAIPEMYIAISGWWHWSPSY